MKTNVLASLVGLALTLALVGCATGPSLAEKLDTIKLEAVPLSFDDPAPAFKKLFPSDSPLRKDSLETEAEFDARLKATGLVGREFTLLISPDWCDVQAMPENNFYTIVSKDSFYSYSTRNDKPYAVTVDRVRDTPGSFVGQNAFGAQATVSVYSSTDYQIHMQNLKALPSILRWTSDGERSPFLHFGLPVRSPPPEFRQLLREKKIGLGVRVRIGDIRKADRDFLVKSPTITSPTSLSITKLIMPVELLEVWVVDTRTNTSVAHWHGEP